MGHAQTYRTWAVFILGGKGDMDKFEAIAQGASYCAGILCNPRTLDWSLVDLDQPALSEEATAALHRRGMGFVGAVGLYRDGAIHFALAEVLPLEIARKLVESLIHHAPNAALPPEPSGDGVDWLERLWSLPDAREDRRA